MGLIDKALARVKDLSGGQQQRVGIARALVQEPRLILADEPIASLDPESSVQILSLLKDICQRDRIAVLVSLHQVEFARQFADRIIGMAAGRIICDQHSVTLEDSEIHALYRHKLEAAVTYRPAVSSSGLLFISSPCCPKLRVFQPLLLPLLRLF